MDSITGFVSYAHNDNHLNRVETLVEELKTEYNILTADELKLFFDRDDLEWGVEWERSINAGIDSASFFIPILSPQYFHSFYCVEELTKYLSKCKDEDSRNLILPILFTDLREVEDDSAGELVRKIKEFQYIDWTDLRFSPRASEKYQRGISEMASRLIKANENLLKASKGNNDVNKVPEKTRDVIREGDSEDEQAYGFLESLEDLDNRSNNITKLINLMSNNMQDISVIVDAATNDLEKIQANNSSGYKMYNSVIAKLATSLNPVASEYDKNVRLCLDEVIAMDSSVRIFIDSSRELKGDSQDNKVFETICTLSDAADSVKIQFERFRDSVRPIKRVSRMIYSPMKTIESATVTCISMLDIIIGWKSFLGR